MEDQIQVVGGTIDDDHSPARRGTRGLQGMVVVVVMVVVGGVDGF